MKNSPNTTKLHRTNILYKYECNVGDCEPQAGLGHFGRGHLGRGHYGRGHLGRGHYGRGHFGRGHLGRGHFDPLI